MGLDLDWLAGKQAIDRLEQLLSDTPHGEREEIANKIINLINTFIEEQRDDKHHHTGIAQG